MLSKIREVIDLEKLKKNKPLLIKVTAGICIFLVTLIIFLGKPANSQIEISTTDDGAVTEEAVTAKEVPSVEKTIYIHVAGAVNNPMVIAIKEGSRVFEAVAAAGGLSENANILDINLAATLTDGDKIYIPQNGENVLPNRDISSASLHSSTKNNIVNINNASAEQLQTLKGVGPSTAEKIIVYRTENGPFKSVDDLQNVSGIGPKTLEKFKEKICI